MINKIPLSKAIIIILILTVLDTFTCVALLIGSYIFAKKGQKGLAMALWCYTKKVDSKKRKMV